MKTDIDSGATDQAGGDAARTQREHARRQLMRQMHGVAGEAGQWLKDAAAEVSDQVGVQGSSQINAQASAQISGQLDGEAAGAAHAANDYVKTHPWAAVGLGAVAGVLLGLLVSKRPR